ncbi:MAG: hypothetical protein BroJett031_34990 [Betaproteobacteria bacterium]|nr:MAG: hypothetical protein BroJett031_34990 [Betaproteobacteria bacterium]
MPAGGGAGEGPGGGAGGGLGGGVGVGLGCGAEPPGASPFQALSPSVLPQPPSKTKPDAATAQTNNRFNIGPLSLKKRPHDDEHSSNDLSARRIIVQRPGLSLPPER